MHYRSLFSQYNNCLSSIITLIDEMNRNVSILNGTKSNIKKLLWLVERIEDVVN